MTDVKRPLPSVPARPIAARTLAGITAVAILGGGALATSAAWGLRAARGSVTTPRELRPGFFGEKGAGGVHSFGARINRRVILFDTGVDPAGRPVDALLGALKATRQDVGDVFVTDGRIEHAAAAALFPSARLWAGVPDVALVAGWKRPRGLLQGLLAALWTVPPAHVTDPLSGEQIVRLDGPAGKAFLRAIPSPGPTRGAYVYLYDAVLIAGDALTLTKDNKLIPARGFQGAGLATSKSSLLALRDTLAGAAVDMVCTSYGGCTLPGEGRASLEALWAAIARNE